MRRIFLLLWLLPAFASAHAVPHPRQLLVRASAVSLELRFAYELGAAEAPKVRRLFDRDRDGTLKGEELEALGVYLERRAVGAFELRRGSDPVEATTSSRQVTGADAMRGNLTVLVTRVWKLDPGPHAFTVWDEGDSMGHMPVKLEADGVTLRFGGVKLGASYDLPARKAVSLSVRAL